MVQSIFRVLPAVLAIVFAPSAAYGAGPISKYDDNVPDIDTVSPIPMYDLVRCLIDLAGHEAPAVYTQPDRPGDIIILWQPNTRSGNRADLQSMQEGTRVKIWNENRQNRSCIESGKRK